MLRLVDVVTARALRLALDGGSETEHAAGQLVESAEGRLLVLELAIARLNRGPEGRTSAVRDRALAALRRAHAQAAALALVS